MIEKENTHLFSLFLLACFLTPRATAATTQINKCARWKESCVGGLLWGDAHTRCPGTCSSGGRRSCWVPRSRSGPGRRASRRWWSTPTCRGDLALRIARLDSGNTHTDARRKIFNIYSSFWISLFSEAQWQQRLSIHFRYIHPSM